MQDQLGTKEQFIPERINVFLHKGPFSENKKIDVGFLGLGTVDMILTYQDAQFTPLRQQSLQLKAQGSLLTSSENDFIFHKLQENGLRKLEVEDVLAAWRTILAFNGGSLSHSDAKAKERATMYVQADYKGESVGIQNFKGKQLVECAEIAAIVHDLFSHNPNYDAYFLTGVSYPEENKPEGHNFNILRDKSGRYVLIDMSYRINMKMSEDSDDRVELPFCAVLSENQIQDLEKGLDITCSFLCGRNRKYRIGTPYTSEGAWKSQF